MTPEYQIFDVVEMKKPHPCNTKSKLFQITRVGSDIKIMCLGCGNVIMLSRDKFNSRIRKVLEHHKDIIKIQEK